MPYAPPPPDIEGGIEGWGGVGGACLNSVQPPLCPDAFCSTEGGVKIHFRTDGDFIGGSLSKFVKLACIIIYADDP